VHGHDQGHVLDGCARRAERTRELQCVRRNWVVHGEDMCAGAGNCVDSRPPDQLHGKEVRHSSSASYGDDSLHAASGGSFKIKVTR